MDNARVNQYLNRLKGLEAEKVNWNTMYQTLGEYIMTRKQDFTKDITPGEFLNEDIFDNTAQHNAVTMASAFLSMLWPDSARTIRIKPPRSIQGKPAVDDYYAWLTDELCRYMDQPEAALALALQEHFLDQAVFGTSGVAALEREGDYVNPLMYKAWDIKTMHIDENSDGLIDTIYNVRRMTVRQVVQEFGEDVVHENVRAQFKAGNFDDKVDVLHVIEPRKLKAPVAGVLGMPWSSVYIDKTNQHFMKESGFRELPVCVVRFLKAMGEKYGRSPGMVAIFDAIQLNASQETLSIAAELALDPPIAILDDGRLGGGVIDRSPGAVNVFNTSGRISNENPIFPLFTLGEMASMKDRIEDLKNSITQAFYVDRLLDLNNQTQMTAYETAIRNRIRGESLGSMFARQELELFTPLIKRSFNILYRMGLLGVTKDKAFDPIVAKLREHGIEPKEIPEEVARLIAVGANAYEIEYISPAKRFMKAEKLQGLSSTVQFIVDLAPVAPEVIDNVDFDKASRAIQELSGAPDILRSFDALAKLRSDREQMQQAAQALQGYELLSKANKNNAAAAAEEGKVAAR